MTDAPMSHVITTAIGRAGRINPRWVRAARPDIVDLWLLTLGRDEHRWQAVLFIAEIPNTGRLLRLHTHQLTVAALDGPLCTPIEVLERGVQIRPDETYMHMLRLREGAPHAWRLANLIAARIMQGELDPVPVRRHDRAEWGLAIGLGISASLSDRGHEFAAIAAVKRDDDA